MAVREGFIWAARREAVDVAASRECGLGNLIRGVQYAFTIPVWRSRPLPRASCFAIALRLVPARKMPAWKPAFSSAVALKAQ